MDKSALERRFIEVATTPALPSSGLTPSMRDLALTAMMHVMTPTEQLTAVARVIAAISPQANKGEADKNGATE